MLNDLIPAETIVLMAGLTLTLAYLIINQYLLRLLIILATALYIWYYAVVADAPLWTAIYTSVAMGVANLVGMGTLLWRQTIWSVPAAHRDIYAHFDGLPPGDFGELVRTAHRRTLTEDTRITTEGDPVDRLTYVISGSLSITKKGEAFAMPPRVFVGEVAFLAHQASAATTYVAAGSEVLEWEFDALRTRAARKSRFKLALEAMISKDLALKVAFAVAPRQGGWAETAQQR